MTITATTADRAAVLDLAENARLENNAPLRDLLLTVAGKLEPDGTVRYPGDRDKFSDLSGPLGKGYDLAARHRGAL